MTKSYINVDCTIHFIIHTIIIPIRQKNQLIWTKHILFRVYRPLPLPASFSRASKLLFLILFADDATVLIEGQNYNNIIFTLNIELQKLNE